MSKKLMMLLPLGFVAGAAFAQGDAQMPDVADSDGNGTYSQGEINAVWPDLEFGKFGEMDTDASGELSPEELQAAWDAGLLMGLTAAPKDEAGDSEGSGG